MSDSYEQFLRSLKNSNSIKVTRSYRLIGDCEGDDLDSIKKTILAMKPRSPKTIITICNRWRRYAEYLGNTELLKNLQAVDSKELWQEAKPYANKKFLSYADYIETCDIIESQWDLLNPLYYKSLFRCLYEGIYSDDMSVLKNLRASDIHENVVTLRDDNGNVYDLDIPLDLATHLSLLPTEPYMRRNRNATFPIAVSGVYHDSCFKVEHRNGSGETTYEHSYYRVLRIITNDYMERKKLLPKQIFISGVMYRIGLKLNEQGISIDEAFSEHNRDRQVGQIIADELLRCNYHMEVRNFRQMVKGHLDVFL